MPVTDTDRDFRLFAGGESQLLDTFVRNMRRQRPRLEAWGYKFSRHTEYSRPLVVGQTVYRQSLIQAARKVGDSNTFTSRNRVQPCG